ncbi:noncanonical pyrimidine nucleotidase, YjjG family [Hanstruepera neustonica]|uniref:Noncanonical pyrimidine nucleotidase, YjjG family n=1 Tax=Hanstruepera neustonica TaxID=1445657 RepID=A0A2K1E507_9FLAO|nr:YjjG family noncanonical pyrimidine nucleotidase [Hanstruepera neustonica]PNQ75366.1 noncanonical pyrimidine nucleotidase, YjjG family [Hanstruepera neustonica]
MGTNSITDIFFDLDHTLWDFDRNSAMTFEKIFRIHNIGVDLPEFLEVYEPINLEYWKLYREDKIDKPSLRYGRLKNSFDKISMSVSDEVINLLSEDYINYLPENNFLFEGAFEILNYLKPKYSLHIITNGFHEVQHGKLDKSNIASYFKTVTTSEMVGVKKPNPLIFHHALELAGVKAKNSLMIGDNLEADVMGSLEVGLDAICFNIHGTELDSNVKQVSNLIELKSFL